MDTSQTYIKMSDNEDIQGPWEPREGDVISDGGGIETIGSILIVSTTMATKGGYDYDFYEYNWKKTIWLPHQDRLQEMVGGDWNHQLFMMDEFLIDKDGDPDLDFVTSMEQLWLAFVMKEKYNKIWNGESWKTDI